MHITNHKSLHHPNISHIYKKSKRNNKCMLKIFKAGLYLYILQTDNERIAIEKVVGFFKKSPPQVCFKVLLVSKSVLYYEL